MAKQAETWSVTVYAGGLRLPLPLPPSTHIDQSLELICWILSKPGMRGRIRAMLQEFHPEFSPRKKDAICQAIFELPTQIRQQALRWAKTLAYPRSGPLLLLTEEDRQRFSATVARLVNENWPRLEAQREAARIHRVGLRTIQRACCQKQKYYTATGRLLTAAEANLVETGSARKIGRGSTLPHRAADAEWSKAGSDQPETRQKPRRLVT